MAYYAQQLINSLQIGSTYALIALGYSLVYGILVMINFAHSTFFMLGALLCLLIVTTFTTLPFAVVLILVMCCIGGLGVLLERVAYRPLRNAPRVSAIITALGCGLVIENLILVRFPYSQSVPTLLQSTTFHFMGITITSLQMMTVGCGLGLMLALDFLIHRTRYGMAMRAISFDMKTVPLMGIPVNRIISLTFFVGAALGGAAGMIYGQVYSIIDPKLGMAIGWKAFIAAVIGGIGSVRGAMLGGFLLAAVETFAVIFWPSSYRDLIAYSLLLVILIVKPYGLLGKAPNQKV